MKLVHFRMHNKYNISFVADKIVAFSEDMTDDKKTIIYTITAYSEDNEGDSFIVDESYDKVLVKMEAIGN